MSVIVYNGAVQSGVVSYNTSIAPYTGGQVRDSYVYTPGASTTLDISSLLYIACRPQYSGKPPFFTYNGDVYLNNVRVAEKAVYHWTPVDGSTITLQEYDIYIVEPVTPTGYTFSYATEHGTAPQSVSNVTTLTSEMLPTLTATGFTFQGLYYESTFTTQAQVGDTLSADTTLYAKWEEQTGSTLDVTYNSQKIIDSLEVTPPVTVTYNGSTIATLNANDTKTLDILGSDNKPKILSTPIVIGGKTIPDVDALGRKWVLEHNLVVEVSGSLPTAFQRCAYIAGTGTQYIDTGVLLNSASSVYVDFIKNTAVAAQQTVFGYEAARSERFMVRVNNGETYYFDTTSGSKKANGAVLGENEVSANLADLTVTVNGTKTQMSSIGFSDTLSTFLFATNGNSAPAAFGEFQLCAATFFSGAVLSRDFIPCYLTAEWNGISAGTIGLYDLAGSICPLTNTPFYINAGTGTFTKGADVL